MADIIMLGAGGIAIVAAEIAALMGLHVVGFLDDRAERHGTMFCGAPVLGPFRMLPELRRSVTSAVVAFGHCSERLQVADAVRSLGFEQPALVHPSAVISRTASVGEGSIIMPGVVINAGARVGRNTIVNTAASIDHECVIEEGVHIAPGVRLSGLVTIGRMSWIGVGSVIRESVHIGSNALVGAGTLVLKNVPDDVVAYGSPARVIRGNSLQQPAAQPSEERPRIPAAA